MKKNLKVVVALTVIVGGIALLAGGKLKDAFRYSEGVSSVSKAGTSMIGRPIRLQGRLVDDSLVKRRESGRPYFEFRVAEAGSEVTVRYDDALPDTLVNGSEVTAEGSLSAPGYFRSTKIFAKCPSKYDMAKTPAGYRPPHDPYSGAGRSAPEARALPEVPPRALAGN